MLALHDFKMSGCTDRTAPHHDVASRSATAGAGISVPGRRRLHPHATVADPPTTPTDQSARLVKITDASPLNSLHFDHDNDQASESPPPPTAATFGLQTPPPMNHILGITSPLSPLRLQFASPLASPGASNTRFGGTGSKFSPNASSASGFGDRYHSHLDDEQTADLPEDGDADRQQLDNDESGVNSDNMGPVLPPPPMLRRNLVEVLGSQLAEVMACLTTNAGGKLETSDLFIIQGHVEEIMDIFRRRRCPNVLVGTSPTQRRTAAVLDNLPRTPIRADRKQTDKPKVSDNNEESKDPGDDDLDNEDCQNSESSNPRRAGDDADSRRHSPIRIAGGQESLPAPSAVTAQPAAARPAVPAEVADLVVAEAEKLCLELSAVAKSLSERRQESDHLLGVLVEGRERAANRILELQSRVEELEDDIGENESELAHLRLKLKAIELQCMERMPGEEDPELLESIDNWRADFEAVQERWRARRSCRNNSDTSISSSYRAGSRQATASSLFSLSATPTRSILSPGSSFLSR